jgi:hypothetical protein
MNKGIWSRLILSAALAGGMMFAMGSPAKADRDYRSDCERRLDADRARIDHDTHRYGEKSHQVDRDIVKMDGDRQWCREHKADWDHSKFDTGIYIHL